MKISIAVQIHQLPIMQAVASTIQIQGQKLANQEDAVQTQIAEQVKLLYKQMQ